jgi:hypothetical protein
MGKQQNNEGKKAHMLFCFCIDAYRYKKEDTRDASRRDDLHS